jgi:hypothetical protein
VLVVALAVAELVAPVVRCEIDDSEDESPQAARDADTTIAETAIVER